MAKKQISKAQASKCATVVSKYAMQEAKKGAKKGAGSVMEGLRKLQQFDNIYIAKTCKNCIREWQSLEHPKNDKTGLIEENKFNIDSHCFSAAIYGLEPFKHYDFKDRIARKPTGW